MLDRNEKLDEARWGAAPGWSPAVYIRDYVERARWVKNLVAVWAVVRGSSLDIYTLIEKDRQSERELHKLELDFFDKWDGAPVRFHISRDPEALQEQLRGTDPVLVVS